MLARRVCIYSTQSARLFSAENGEKAAGAGEWGIKYDDECLKFEKEWEQIANKVESEQNVYLKNELSELQ